MANWKPVPRAEAPRPANRLFFIGRRATSQSIFCTVTRVWGPSKNSLSDRLRPVGHQNTIPPARQGRMLREHPLYGLHVPMGSGRAEKRHEDEARTLVLGRERLRMAPGRLPTDSCPSSRALRIVNGSPSHMF